MTSRRAALAVGIVAVVGAAAACTTGRGTDTATVPDAPDGAVTSTVPAARGSAVTSAVPTTTVTERADALIANVKGEVAVYDASGASRPARTFAVTTPNGSPRVFLVVEEDSEWLKVLLPVRPNGTTGWIRRADVEVRRTGYRVVVELGAHRVTVYDGERVVLAEPVGVGTGDTPTPLGEFYITDLLRPPDPGGPYGPYAFGLSGYSEVLTDFAGGEGVVGLHGTNDPASLGRDVSHGCIRLANDAVTTLAGLLPLGTPVAIRP